MDWSALGLLVSTLAACGAAAFAYLTVRDGRKFHDDQERERQLDQLLAITRTVSDVADTAVRIGNGAHFEYGLFYARQLKLRVELAAWQGAPLPLCAAAAAQISSEGAGLSENVGQKAAAAHSALGELEEVVRAL
jgi:hypothetical protein